MSKIVVTKEVRSLLAELDQAMQLFHNQTLILSGREISHSRAVDIGAERESNKISILGIAYRLNKASTGDKS